MDKLSVVRHDKIVNIIYTNNIKIFELDFSIISFILV